MQHFLTIDRTSVRILLTGASGFLGRALLHQLLKENHQILAIARNPLLVEYPSVYWKSADLNQPSTYQGQLSEFSPEALIHLAWQDIPNFSLSTSLLNLQHSLSLFRTVLELGNCQKILVAGSCWELNKQQGECLESEAGSPRDHFTWAKHSLHSWLDMETSQRGISLGWLRIFYVYGPRQRSASLLPTIFKELQERRLPQLKTPHNANDFVFVEDVGKGFVQAIEHKFQSGVFHLGSGHSTPVWQLCQAAEELILGTTVLTEELMEKHPKPTQAEVEFWANCERSQQFLGWSPLTSLESGIQKTWEWMQAA